MKNKRVKELRFSVSSSINLNFHEKYFQLCISSRLELKINNVCKASLFPPQYHHHFSFDFFTRLASITPACK